MGWAPDHSFADSSTAQRPGALHPELHLFGDRSRAVGASTELGHRMEIVLFSGGEAIKAHPKKMAIQSVTGLITGREAHDFSESIGIDLCAFRL